MVVSSSIVREILSNKKCLIMICWCVRADKVAKPLVAYQYIEAFYLDGKEICCPTATKLLSSVITYQDDVIWTLQWVQEQWTTNPIWKGSTQAQSWCNLSILFAPRFTHSSLWEMTSLMKHFISTTNCTFDNNSQAWYIQKGLQVCILASFILVLSRAWRRG